MKSLRLLIALSCLIALAACDSDKEIELRGLRRTPAGSGPQVVFDPLNLPMPEIPFPNNLAARYDADSPTGLRLNFPTNAITGVERRTRELINNMTGFGTFAPISISFDQPLDVTTINSKSIKVINISQSRRAHPCTHPNCPNSLKYGAEADLEFGQGRFPLLIEPFDFYPSDPIMNANNVLYTPSEMLYGFDENNVFDRYWTDLDGDGEVDHGNEYDFNDDGVYDQNTELVTYYEFESNSLVLRPLYPYDQRAMYAVVITEDLKGLDGQPVRSPFPYVNHIAQTNDLMPLFDDKILLNLDPPVSLEDVAFTWVFTTQDITGDLEAIQAGLKGEGTMASLAKEYPPVLLEVTDLGEQVKDSANAPDDNVYLLQPSAFKGLADILVEVVFPSEDPTITFETVDHFVFGKFLSPNFRGTADHVFDVNPKTGKYFAKPGEVTFMLSVPVESEEHQAPFPVILYCHGTGVSRIEIIAEANSMAKQGIAMLAIDAVSHGPIYDLTNLDYVSAELPAGMPFSVVAGLVASALGIEVSLGGKTDEEILDELMSIGLLRAIFGEGRAEDVNADGYLENGSGFWTPDVFETREAVRQTTVDFMQIARVLQNFGTRRSFDYNRDGVLDLDGDFNTDGVIDVGGPEVKLYTSGISLGGITSSVVLGSLDDVTAGAPVVPGGGLADILVRSTLHSTTKYMMHQVSGPFVIGRPDPNALPPIDATSPSTVVLSWNDERDNFARIEITPGDTVRVANLANGEIREVAPEADGSFSLGIPSDFSDPIKVTLIDEAGNEKTSIDSVRVILKEGKSIPIADRPEIIYLQTNYQLDEQEEVPEGYYVVDAPLTTISQGMGYSRNTPDFRRFVGIGQMVFDGGDPINYAPHYFLDPLPNKGIKNVLFEMAPGDDTVPHSSGIALAAAAGLVGEEVWQQLADVGDLLLFDGWYLNQQYGGGSRQYVYDIDDLDENNEQTLRSDGTYMPAAVGPLTPVDNRNIGGGFSSARFPYDPTNHSFLAAPWDASFANFTSYAQHQMAAFFARNDSSELTADQVIVDCTRQQIDCSYNRITGACVPCELLPQHTEE